MDYNLLNTALLAAWLFTGLIAINEAERYQEIAGKWGLLLNFAAIIAGPPVWACLKLYESISQINFNFSSRHQPTNKYAVDLLDSRGHLIISDRGMESETVNNTKRIIYDSITRRASDVFIDPKPNGSYVVRYRVDGGLKIIEEFSETSGSALISSIKAAAGMDIAEKRRPQDGSFCAKMGNGKVSSFRVASVGAFGGEKITMRVLAASTGPLELSDIGLVGDNLKIVQNAVKLPSGLILICGPTGSGKTSTLYAMLQSMDKSMRNIISIEDPIEHVMENVSQMEVNIKADITFASLLRNSLRQNPDVICVGEIRDEETAEIAVHAAQTGHLIVATLHSNDNMGTIDRLTNLGVALRTSAATVRMIMSQRLVRKLCPKCKEKTSLPDKYRQYFKDANLPADNIYHACGCRECEGSGFAGRMAIFDILVMTEALKHALEEPDANMTAIKAKFSETGGTTMLAYEGFKLVAAGETSLEEVERVTLRLD